MNSLFHRIGIALCVFFAVAAVIACAQKPDPNAACMGNLKQLGLALLMYTQDFDGKLPPMRAPAQVKAKISPYVRNPQTFTCPVTKLPYEPTGGLSYMMLKKIPKPAQTVAMRDSRKHPDGLWSVLYLDGHVKREKALSPPKPAGK